MDTEKWVLRAVFLLGLGIIIAALIENGILPEWVAVTFIMTPAVAWCGWFSYAYWHHNKPPKDR